MSESERLEEKLDKEWQEEVRTEEAKEKELERQDFLSRKFGEFLSQEQIKLFAKDGQLSEKNREVLVTSVLTEATPDFLSELLHDLVFNEEEEGYNWILPLETAAEFCENFRFHSLGELKDVIDREENLCLPFDGKGKFNSASFFEESFSGLQRIAIVHAILYLGEESEEEKEIIKKLPALCLFESKEVSIYLSLEKTLELGVSPEDSDGKIFQARGAAKNLPPSMTTTELSTFILHHLGRLEELPGRYYQPALPGMPKS
jgi:hypothetical protein